MKSSLKGLTAIAGVTYAIIGAGPVALAAAAPGGTSSAGGSPLPGQSCDVNQGLPAGSPNLGPTGPLGPLGPAGPGGNNNSLPCGGSALNLGPSGPLGPGGALGSGQQSAPQPTPGPQSHRAPHSRPGKHAPAKHSSARRTHKHSKPGHGHR